MRQVLYYRWVHQSGRDSEAPFDLDQAMEPIHYTGPWWAFALIGAAAWLSRAAWSMREWGEARCRQEDASR